MVLHSNYGLPDDQRATDWPRKRYGWLNIVGVRNFFFFKLRPSFKTHPLIFTNFFFFFISVKFQNIPIQQQQRFSMITNTENSSLEPWAAEVDLSLVFENTSLSLSPDLNLLLPHDLNFGLLFFPLSLSVELELG